jgi:hypothetical protein
VTALNDRISKRPTRQTALLDQLTKENKTLPDATPPEAKALFDRHKIIHDGLSGLSLTDDKIDSLLDTAANDIATFSSEVKKVEAAIAVRAKATAVIMKAAGEVWDDEKERLMGLLPRDLFDIQGRAEWKKKLTDVTDPEWLSLQTPLKQAMAAVTGQKQLKETAKIVIDKDAAARDKTWTAAMWAEVAAKKRGTTPRVTPTRDAIWQLLQWGSIRGRAWNLRVIRPASGQRKELHITVSGDSIPEPADVIGSDPGLLDKSPAEIFDILFQHQSRALRVHVTKGDEASYRAGLNQHLFIGDACGAGDFDGDGGAMAKGLTDFRDSAIRHFIRAKMKDWAI